MDKTITTRSFSLLDVFSDFDRICLFAGILVLAAFFLLGIRSLKSDKPKRNWSLLLIYSGLVFSIFPIARVLLCAGTTLYFFGMDGGTGYFDYGQLQTDVGSYFIFIALHLFFIPISALLAVTLKLVDKPKKNG